MAIRSDRTRPILRSTDAPAGRTFEPSETTVAADLVQPQRLSVAACCTGPADTRIDVRTLVTTEFNRWSREGEPTIYLGADAGVALAELGRHWAEQRGEMAVWSAKLDLDRAVDLRDPAVRSRLDLPEDPAWIRDADRCRRLASSLRSTGGYGGLMAPSAAFLDDPGRWTAVVFVERQVRPLEEALGIGSIVIRIAST